MNIHILFMEKQKPRGVTASQRQLRLEPKSLNHSFMLVPLTGQRLRKMVRVSPQHLPASGYAKSCHVDLKSIFTNDSCPNTTEDIHHRNVSL